MQNVDIMHLANHLNIYNLNSNLISSENTEYKGKV